MKADTIGVLCAMEKELSPLVEKLQSAEKITLGGIEFTKGTFAGKSVVLCLCGIGKVFAAMATQTMILEFAPDLILFSGVAGSLTPFLSVLDLAISSDFVQHDLDTSAIGDPKGYVSGIGKVYLPASPELAALAEKCARSLGIHTLTGTIASGDVFVADRQKKEEIVRTFGAIACEMEGAAAAQAAFVNRVPFCAIRAVSDSFDGSGAMEYAAFAEKAARQSAGLLCAMIENL